MINDAPLPGTAGIERGLWRAAGIRSQEMNWYQYLFAILLFNALGLLVLFTLLMFGARCRSIRSTCPACRGTGAEYGGELCQQHQLAGLCR